MDRSSAGSTDWSGVTISADGTQLAAVDNAHDKVFTSSDSGATWVGHIVPGGLNIDKIAGSTDGSHLLLGDSSPGQLFTSANFGVNWTDRTNAGTSSWQSVVSSADGSHLAAVSDSPGDIFTSSDSGATWTDRASAGNRSWFALAMNSTGTKIVGADEAGSLYVSLDSGATWNPLTVTGAGSTPPFTGIAMSSDGVHLATTVFNGDIFTSSDSGTTWTDETGAGSGFWYDIAMSASSTELVAFKYGGDVSTGASAGGGGDVTPPTVSLTAPLSGATISGTSVTLSATASDNVALGGVTFYVDSTKLGSEITSAPFQITLDSTGLSNGSHTISAVARDTSNNYATSTVSVTVSNSSGGGGGGGGSGGSGGGSVGNGGGTTGNSIITEAMFFIANGEQDKLIALVAGNVSEFTWYKDQGFALPPEVLALLNPTTTTTQIAVSIASATTFTRSLTIGSSGTDVHALQLFLISKSTGSAAKALMENGATNYFGKLTQAALAEYQKSVGITPAIGYFGSLTKTYLQNNP